MRLLGAVYGPPLAHTPLQGPAYARIEFRMAARELEILRAMKEDSSE